MTRAVFAPRRLAAALLCLALISSAGWVFGRGSSAGAKSPAVPARGYRLVKEWDFVREIRTRAALEAEFFTRYVYENGKLDHLNDEWSRYRDQENHVFTPDGLALVARHRGRLAPGEITSGMLRSRFTFAYGIVEIRMKVPKGRGFWPAVWLNPEDGRWPPEIDIVEVVNDRESAPDRSFHFLHGAGRSPEAPLKSLLGSDKAYRAGVDLSLDFHVFAVEWTKSRVRHFVDGVLVADRGYRWIHDDGADGGPAHLLVNLAVGGKWPGAPHDVAAFPASLEIAQIRVWQR
jgi:beta-glucanase (GH16 family)